MNGLPVLYEDNHLLVINKPPGLPTMGVGPELESVHTRAAAYLKKRYDKPGKVFVGIVSRLDRLVSGVLVLARTSKAASRLSEQFRTGQVEKLYTAWVEGQLASERDAPVPSADPPTNSGSASGTTSDSATSWKELCDWVAKDDTHHRMRIVSEQASGALLAHLRFQVIDIQPRRTELRVQLLTGRKHQIRLQLSEIGHPIVGDQKYGASTRFPSGIALHCQQVTLTHPTLKESMSFVAPLPNTWR